MRTQDANIAIPTAAEATLRDALAVNSCTSGSNPCFEKMCAMVSAAARSSSLQAGVMPMFCSRWFKYF